MTKFEYKHVATDYKYDTIGEVLTEFGEEGWEILWYEEVKQQNKMVHLKMLMKRVKKGKFL